MPSVGKLSKKGCDKVKVKFVWPADEELGEVIEYYNQKKSGLGQRFFEEVNEAIERIIRFPLASSKVGQNTRRSLLRKFPYSLLYVVEQNMILVVAVAHQQKKPSYYADRIR